MLSKINLIIFTVLLLGGSYFYFSSNSSYKDSFQARVYYMLGNYESAYNLAKKALVEDSYNKMANTIVTQSKIALTYEKYIAQGNKYLKTIDSISSKNEYSKKDKTRIKFMCEIMIKGYDELKPSTLTGENLLENSKKMQKKFKQLYEELF